MRREGDATPHVVGAKLRSSLAGDESRRRVLPSRARAQRAGSGSLRVKARSVIVSIMSRSAHGRPRSVQSSTSRLSSSPVLRHRYVTTAEPLSVVRVSPSIVKAPRSPSGMPPTRQSSSPKTNPCHQFGPENLRRIAVSGARPDSRSRSSASTARSSAVSAESQLPSSTPSP